jgi:hypothetical protein
MKNLLLFFFTTLALNLFAQRQEDTEFNKINEEISKEMETYNKKIEASFKKENPNLMKEMLDKLTQVSKIENEDEREKALKDYQKIYLKQYTLIVQKSGVNFSAFITKLKRKYKNYNFEILDNFAIFVENKEPDTENAVKKQNRPVGTTEVVEIKDLKTMSEEDCALIGSTKTTITTNSAESKARATAAGNCDAASMIYGNYLLPSAQKIVLKISYKFNMKVEAIAVGAIGVSSFAGNTLISGIDCNPECNSDFISTCNGNCNVNTSFKYKSISCIAAILWGTSEKRKRDYEEIIDLSQYKGKKIDMVGTCLVSSIGMGVCNAYSRATVTIKSSKLEITY